MPRRRLSTLATIPVGPRNSRLAVLSDHRRVRQNAAAAAAARLAGEGFRYVINEAGRRVRQYFDGSTSATNNNRQNLRPVKRQKFSNMSGSFNARGGSQSSYIDVALSGEELNNSGKVILINAVPQGAGTSQRIGRKWNMSSASFAFHFEGVTSGNFPTTARMWLIWDKMPQGNLPSLGDIFADPSNLSRTQKNDAHSKRFTIVRDWPNIMVGSTATSLSSLPSSKVEKYEYVSFGKNGKTVTNRDVGTGAIGDIEVGALYLVTSSLSSTAATNPDMWANIRIRYHDIVGR